MSGTDWKSKIADAVERLRTRYDHIGRTTGAPFLALTYPPAAERAVLAEWRTQAEAVAGELTISRVDALDLTEGCVDAFGVENVVDALVTPMPGSQPDGELGRVWLKKIAAEVRARFETVQGARPVVSVERLAALYPAAGPRDLMQMLWDDDGQSLKGPVVFLIPGSWTAARTYSFLECRSEFMYRGDLL